jgi:hypothetical protein
MKCSVHGAEAVAVCCYCGRALCNECESGAQSGVTAQSSATTKTAVVSPSRSVCFEACATALEQPGAVLQQVPSLNQQLLRQSLRNTQASALYCYLGGGLSLGGAVVAWFILPSTFLILFTGACGVMLLLSGFWYSRAARKEGL